MAKGEMTLAAMVFDPDCTVSIKAMEIKGFIVMHNARWISKGKAGVPVELGLKV